MSLLSFLKILNPKEFQFVSKLLNCSSYLIYIKNNFKHSIFWCYEAYIKFVFLVWIFHEVSIHEVSKQLKSDLFKPIYTIRFKTHDAT